MNRQSRELALHLDAPSPTPWVTRGITLAAALVLLWLTYSVAPDWVRHLDGTSWSERLDDSWLAQLFDGLGRWWDDLSAWQKILAIGLVVAAPTVLLLGAGTSAAFAGLSLGATAWTVADHADQTADFIRDPVGTTKRYLANASPGSLALDAGTLALSLWLPGKAIQHLTPAARRVPAIVSDYMDNPRAYLDAQHAWRRANPRGEGGHITYGHTDGLPRINGRRPINYMWANKTYNGAKWTPDLAAKYPQGVPFDANGFPVFDNYAQARWQPSHGGKFTGKWDLDVKAANADMQRRFPDQNWSKTPDGYTWHHVEDGRTMLLVPRDIHKAVRHTGGVAVIR
jgi:hypothetical protein